MAFHNTLNGRMEELRFPAVRSPETEIPYSAHLASARDSNPLFSNMGTSNPADVRGSLQRRFTADSMKLPMGRSSFGQQYSSLNSAAQMEQKQIYEDIQNARRKAHEQLALLDEKERKLQFGGHPTQDVDRINNGLGRMSLNGPVSEPTTPPDYSEDVFSNRHSRSSRLSMSNVTSPPGLTKRTSYTSSKVTSPPTNRTPASGPYSSHRQSTKSMPGSRRGSDEEEDYVDHLPTNRSAATLNRFSMPVNGTRRSQTNGVRPAVNTGIAINDYSFLLDESDAINDTYSALTGDDSFPTLISDGVKLSANSAALDLAKSRRSEADLWAHGIRPRPGHASMPHNDSSMYRPDLSSLNSPPERHSDLSRYQGQRHSMGVTFDENLSPMPPNTMPTTRPTPLQTSYSTNDVPTMKKSLGLDTTMPNTHANQADQSFHAHNISLGRIPVGAYNNRQSREMSLSSVSYKPEDQNLIPSSGLQASAAPFGPGFTSAADSSTMTLSSPVDNFTGQNYYQYNMQTYDISAAMNGQNNAQANYPQAGNMPAYGRQDARLGRRVQDGTRFENAPLETYENELYNMSKDQHGCRYMQRKLEEGNPAHIDLIYRKTCSHIIELMTDPFGNYLCQKLFEYCNDTQRTSLIKAAAPALPAIALNQHGTRALQKLIEFVKTDPQISIIIRALSDHVVGLVQDLNGNHVIQKCLQNLGPDRCQFIYDSVGTYCLIVGSHRHGCCVLQRCIDHAKGAQRANLVAQITLCAFDLVQDPYGNYVVQYILDLDEITYTRPLCNSFKNRIVDLSKQKFSSNVIEKCLRVSDPDTKKFMIEEMMMGHELEGMLRDSYANYVVQTALDYSDERTKARMMDIIGPILPQIKQTPHGRRIASKFQSLKAAQAAQVAQATQSALPPQQAGMTDNTFAAGRSNNRRQIQINGGGFVYGGHDPTHYTREDYGSGKPGLVNPLGHTTGHHINSFRGNYTGNGMGNYI